MRSLLLSTSTGFGRGHFRSPALFPGRFGRWIGAVCTTVIATTAVASDSHAAKPDADCVHLMELLAIERHLHKDLKLDKVRIRCGKAYHDGKSTVRPLRLFRMPTHESLVRLDRFNGRLVSIEVDRMPIPRLKVPAGGWQKLGAVEKVARREGEVPSEASLVIAEHVVDSDSGLPAGAHPFARFVFEHVVEGAHVIGDRIEVRVDLRAGHVTWLDARRWTAVKAPDRRVTESRGLRLARKTIKRLKPGLLPCCQDPRAGMNAELAVADALADRRRKKGGKGAKKVKKSRKRKRRRRRKRKDVAIQCDLSLKRRVYLHDRKGRLVEAYEYGCVPSCTNKGVTRQCSRQSRVSVYVTTKRGKLLGMKGEIAPDRYRWLPPPAPYPAGLAEAKLQARGDKILKRQIRLVEPRAEYKSSRCPPTEEDTLTYRRCWNLMLPAMQYNARQGGGRVIFELPR